jgi:hypothetical protein
MTPDQRTLIREIVMREYGAEMDIEELEFSLATRRKKRSLTIELDSFADLEIRENRAMVVPLLVVLPDTVDAHIAGIRRACEVAAQIQAVLTGGEQVEPQRERTNVWDRLGGDEEAAT